MRLIKDCRGAISVYLCIIFIALLLLAGVIIDASRIMVAERKVENALNAAARSVLADYSADMVGDYGIFGVDTMSGANTAEEDFLYYLKQNLSERNPRFRFIRYEICQESGETSLVGSGSLLRGYDFRNQILQHMKYKAPIASIQNIVSKFKASGLSGKLSFAKSEKEVRSKWKAVKKQRDSVNKLISEAKEFTGHDMEALLVIRQKLQEAMELNDGIAGSLQAYEEEKEKSDAVALAVNSSNSDVNGMQISTARTSFDGLKEASSALKDQIAANIGNLDNIIDQVEKMQAELAGLNTEAAVLRDKIQELQRIVDSSRGNGGDKETEDGSEEGKGGSEGQGHKEGRSGEDQADKAEKELAELNNRLESLEGQIEGLNSRIRDMQNNFQLADMRLLPEEDTDTPRKELNSELEKSAKGLIKKLVEDIGLYRADMDQERMIDARYLEGGSDAYEQKELVNGLEGRDGILEENEAEAENMNVLGIMSQLVNALTDVGESALEKIYITEYIMDRYSYLSSKAERKHFFENGEVEYILWGDVNWSRNVTKTVGTIWTIRFAINTIDTFATSPVPEPVTRLINALTEGFLLSCKDMMDLCQGKEIGICPSVKNGIKLNYADHLRICLLLSSSTEKGEINRLNNMRQLMQINIKELDDGFALKNYSTMLHGKVKVKINLWFLPVFNLDRMGFKNFEGGSYVIEKETHIGY